VVLSITLKVLHRPGPQQGAEAFRDRGVAFDVLGQLGKRFVGCELGTGISAHSPAHDTRPHIVVVRLKNHVGEVAVEGPVEDIEALEAAAQRLIRGMAGPA
jgi:hypothetical protein